MKNEIKHHEDAVYLASLAVVAANRSDCSRNRDDLCVALYSLDEAHQNLAAAKRVSHRQGVFEEAIDEMNVLERVMKEEADDPADVLDGDRMASVDTLMEILKRLRS